MQNLSAFQLLPEHVVKLIVDHVACPSRHKLDGARLTSHVSSALQIPLLWVCHNFRAFVFTRFCSDYALYLRSELDAYHVTRCSWPLCLQGLNCYPTNRLAKRLEVTLDIWDIYSGKSLQQLSSAPYDGCAFPLVRTLAFNIRVYKHSEEKRDYDHPTEDYKIPPPGSEAKIYAFVQRVKDMAPAVSEIYLDTRDTDFEPSECNESHALLLVSQLYRVVETTIVSERNNDLVFSPGLAPIGNLTSIKFDIHGCDYSILPLVRQNAQSLQTLVVRLLMNLDISELIQYPGDGGKYIEYPRLHTLDISGSDARQRPGFNGAVPFPNLRRLTLLLRYPFDDDVLFRGNGATLENLSMMLHPAVVALLKRHNVFTRTSHPKLRVCSYGFRDDEPSAFDTASDYVKFVLSIAPAAPVQMLHALSGSSEALMPALSLLGGHTSIQVLSMYRVRLSFWDTLIFIKSLPLLSDLHTMAPTLGDIPQGVTDVDLPEYVHSTYAPMGKRFRCWHIAPHSKTVNVELVTFMLLLALACPNFDYAAVYKDYREPFMKEMRSQIAEPRFSEHATRLNRLLFNGWQR
ncbi:hypothetical protein GGH94_005939 [Coemansia aciculifera]|uniref:Uncharacterized protein n=1 Tax=Coemansia aciculifera TaxID=417176 RepID=A0A9W8M0T5_9FUNG|nr:hypothetical protein GGH94_005939 [Coemansia aciculifera]KAJ2870041.1 hypothetical protein GGH93_005870 [Coemansia aciculifera]